MNKQLIVKNRRRRIDGGFSYVPHQFLRDGFFEMLRHDELILYFFFVMAADSNGLSYYSSRTITQILKMNNEAYQHALNRLLDLDLIATKEVLVQVLQLPDTQVNPAGGSHPERLI